MLGQKFIFFCFVLINVKEGGITFKTPECRNIETTEKGFQKNQ